MEQNETTIEESNKLLNSGPWGIWPTIGFSIIIVIVGIIIQVAVTLAFIIPAAAKDNNLDVKQFVENLSTNGLCQSMVTIAAAPFTIGLILLFVKIRKGITIKQYLGLRDTGWRNILKWSLIAVVFVCIIDISTYFLGKPIVLEDMAKTYTTSYFPPLLWLAIIFIAPIVEELFFRDFLFVSLKNTKFKVTGTIIITSLAFAMIHTQYDAYGIFTVFLGGLLLGFSRVKSDSIYPPLAIHITNNAISVIETIVYITYFQN